METVVKVYHLGRLSFKVSMYGNDIHLIRLPELNVEGHMHQQCYMYLRETLDFVELGFDSKEEAEQCLSNNSGLLSDRYVGSEFIGRESQSENNSPDIALDGFLDYELAYAFDVISKDDELYNKIIQLYMDNKLLEA